MKSQGEIASDFDLKGKVLKGGLALSIRSVAIFLVAALGNIILVRLLSIRDYGLYAIAAFTFTFLNNIIEAGVATYIIKNREGELTDQSLAAIFTFLQLVFLVVALVTAFGLASGVSRWYKEPDLYTLIILICVPLYCNVWARIPLALLEREMEYKKVGLIEWLSQCLYYGPAVLAAWAGLGVYALLVGEISKALTQAGLACALQRVRWGLSLNRQRIWEIARFGFSFKGANLIWDVNGAAAPLLVGKLVGLEELGIIRVAQGLLNQLSFFQGIIWRVSVPAIAKIQEEKERVARLVTQASHIQVLLVGFPIFLVAGISYWLIPLLYGAKWQAAPLVVLISSFYSVLHAVFFMQMAPFFATGQASAVSVFNLCYTVTLWTASFFLTFQFGYLGFCAAGYVLSLVHLVAYCLFKKHYNLYPIFKLSICVILLYIVSSCAFILNNLFLSFIFITVSFIIICLFFIDIKGVICYLYQRQDSRVAPLRQT